MGTEYLPELIGLLLQLAIGQAAFPEGDRKMFRVSVHTSFEKLVQAGLLAHRSKSPLLAEQVVQQGGRRQA